LLRQLPPQKISRKAKPKANPKSISIWINEDDHNIVYTFVLDLIFHGKKDALPVPALIVDHDLVKLLLAENEGILDGSKSWDTVHLIPSKEIF
jgi:hypothetical protein